MIPIYFLLDFFDYDITSKFISLQVAENRNQL